MDNRTITLFIDDEPREFKILFTYHHDERNRDFVYIYDEENPEDVMLFEVIDGGEDNGTLAPVEDEEILAEAQEILDAYDEEQLGETEVPEI